MDFCCDFFCRLKNLIFKRSSIGLIKKKSNFFVKIKLRKNFSFNFMNEFLLKKNVYKTYFLISFEKLIIKFLWKVLLFSLPFFSGVYY